MIGILACACGVAAPGLVRFQWEASRRKTCQSNGAAMIHGRYRDRSWVGNPAAHTA